jgi:hypothetical protein
MLACFRSQITSSSDRGLSSPSTAEVKLLDVQGGTAMLNPTDHPVHVPSILSLTALALEGTRSQQIIDRVTAVRGYAELSVMYPEKSQYRDAVARSLKSLSDALEARGERTVAQMARSMADTR